MFRPWVLGLLAAAAAYALVSNAKAAAHRAVRAEIAAEKLRAAWAANHTTA